MAVEVGKRADMDMNDFHLMADNVKAQARRAIVGKESLIFDIFTALLAGGNVMLEGVPGVAKTTMRRFRHGDGP